MISYYLFTQTIKQQTYFVSIVQSLTSLENLEKL